MSPPAVFSYESAPVVSVVIITRHRADMVRECLARLAQEEGEPFEVIVVDNSDDWATARVVRECPGAIYHRVPHTFNFQTFTRNEGVRLARGRICAFLDDDSMVEPGWLKACVRGYSASDVGAVGGRILDPEVEHNDFHRSAPICRLLSNGLRTDNCDCDPGRPVEVHHLRGCNYSCRRDALLQAGGFDNCLPGYGFQDLDLLTRIGQLGFRILFNPPMQVYHRIAPREMLPHGPLDWVGEFRRRFRRCRNLAYIYTKNFSVTPKSISFRYLTTTDTGCRALFCKPSLRSLMYTTSGFLGKAAGVVHYVRHRRLAPKVSARVNRRVSARVRCRKESGQCRDH